MFYLVPPDVPVTYKATNSVTTHDLNLHLHQLDWTVFSSVDADLDIEQGLSGLTSNLQSTIDILAPDKIIKPQKIKYPWLNPELRLLKSKRDATSRRYHRTGSSRLLNEFLSLANSYEEKFEMARCAYMHNRICNTLEDGKNFWNENGVWDSSQK